MRSLPLAVAAVLAPLSIATPVMAQRNLNVPATAGWKHAETGVILRASLAGLPRTAIADNSDAELDVFAQFGAPEATAITVYIFRPALESAPIWFDRVETQILTRDIYGGATPQGMPIAFARPKSRTPSALRRAYVPGRGAYKSTAAAVIPIGEWLVAIRISSHDLDAALLDARLSDAIAGIGWPDGAAESPAAVPIAPCPAPLAYAKRAKLKKPDMGDALIGSVLASMASDPTAEKVETGPITWCREGTATSEFGTYRANAATTSYVMAIGDAGTTLSVGGGFPLGKDPGYMLTLGLLDRTLVYPSFNGLPRPEAAYQAVKTSQPISSTSRGSTDINIHTDK